MRAPKFTDPEIARMRDLRTGGWSLAAIAEEFGTGKG